MKNVSLFYSPFIRSSLLYINLQIIKISFEEPAKV